MLDQMLSTAGVLVVQFTPIFEVEGTKATADDSVPVPAALTALIFT